MDSLLQKALEARRHAYSPYSKFPVGAALEGEDGTVYTGCNVENASFGLAVCAERAALINAVSQGVRRFKRLAIVADTSAPAVPCGMCRQMFAEFEPDLELLLANTKGETEQTTLSRLLPKAFSLSAK